eukprot:45541-Rhodomonas_salina.1
MQTNQPKPVSYSQEAISTRLYHTAVSLHTVREAPDKEEATHRTTKVHVRRKAEGSVLPHFTVPVETKAWRRPITEPRARIDHPLWTQPTPSGLVTVDLSEGDKQVLDFADPVWERAGRVCINERITGSDSDATDSNEDGGGGGKLYESKKKKVTVEARKFHWIMEGWKGKKTPCLSRWGKRWGN